ncbi:MAG: 3'-5' exonuclease domain-containing protein 2 [Bacteroidales bacterium]|nr:3'-5' exonuclease domain-containing protein 2 [Bacteroidales bacterium]
MLVKISKQELEALPKVEFSGKIIVINSPEQAKLAVQEIRDAHALIGFDTETRPAFTKGVVYKVSLIQLSVGDTAYLFRLNKMKGISPELKDLLCDSSCIKVGLSTHDDFHNLRRWDEKLSPKGVIELQELVKKYGIEDMSLAKVYGILFGKKISKRQRLTNWEAEELTEKQQQYAALDAVACVEIYNQLLKMGDKIIAL